jgi:hypothetical protein
MTDEKVGRDGELELVAISTGSMKACHLESSHEWEVFAQGGKWYGDGRPSTNYLYQPDWISEVGCAAIFCNATRAFSPETADPGPLGADVERILRLAVERTDAAVAKETAKKPELASDKGLRAREYFKMRQSYLAFTNKQTPVDGEMLCEFYNVLWVERVDGIAYRRACGWVPKLVWEAHASDSVQVKMG